MLNEITENRNDVSVTVGLSISRKAFAAQSKKDPETGLIPECVAGMNAGCDCATKRQSRQKEKRGAPLNCAVDRKTISLCTKTNQNP
jgi:hypothetical protein